MLVGAVVDGRCKGHACGLDQGSQWSLCCICAWYGISGMRSVKDMGRQAVNACVGWHVIILWRASRMSYGREVWRVGACLAATHPKDRWMSLTLRGGPCIR